MVTRQCRDGHRTLALSVDLYETISQHIQCSTNVLEIPRPAAVDNGLQAAQVRTVLPRMSHQAMDLGRRCEERHSAPAIGEREDLLSIEATTFRNHLIRRGRVRLPFSRPVVVILEPSDSMTELRVSFMHSIHKSNRILTASR
jgi:hypothetical protein